MTTGIHEIALRMLSRRALSERELVERLVRKGFAERAAAAEVRRLRAVGLLDDDRLAAAVATEAERRGRGRRAAQAALMRRGLQEKTPQALALIDGAAALEIALARASRRFPEWRQVGGQRRKVVRYLLARGFDLDQVQAALASSGDEREHEQEQP